MFGFITNWRLRRAAQRISVELGPYLIRQFGGSEHYTQPQIARAVDELDLDRRYASLAYAAFMSRKDFANVVQALKAEGGKLLDYDDALDALERYKPWVGRWRPLRRPSIGPRSGLR